MQSGHRVFWRSVLTFVGSMIGVGIFGLPFVFAQSGFFIGAAHLIIIGLLFMSVLAMYADILINTPGHSRLAGLTQKYLSPYWKLPTSILHYCHSWGAMLAYIIIGGEFLFALIGNAAGGSILFYQIAFGLAMSFLLIGGLGLVSRIEGIFVWVLIFLLLVISIGSLPSADISHIMEIHPGNWFLPFGVTLFAFGGIAALPEARDVLGPKRHQLRKTVVVSTLLVAVIYLIFSAVVVMATGENTTQEAILGLGNVIGDWAITLGAFIGLFSVFTSFLVLGVSIMDGLIFDFHVRYLPAWFIAVLIPMSMFLLGARDFIDVISFTGAILGSLIALIVIYLYLKAKKAVCLPHRCLVIPRWIPIIAGCFFFLGLALTLISFSL